MEQWGHEFNQAQSARINDFAESWTVFFCMTSVFLWINSVNDLWGRRQERFSIEFSPEFSPILAKIWVNCKKMRKFGWRKWHQLWREFSWECTWRKCHPIWQKFLWILKWGENLSDESVTKFGKNDESDEKKIKILWQKHLSWRRFYTGGCDLRIIFKHFWWYWCW